MPPRTELMRDYEQLRGPSEGNRFRQSVAIQPLVSIALACLAMHDHFTRRTRAVRRPSSSVKAGVCRTRFDDDSLLRSMELRDISCLLHGMCDLINGISCLLHGSSCQMNGFFHPLGSFPYLMTRSSRWQHRSACWMKEASDQETCLFDQQNRSSDRPSRSSC